MISNYLWKFGNQSRIRVEVFINPIAPFTNQVIDRGTDQEDHIAKRVVVEDEYP